MSRLEIPKATVDVYADWERFTSRHELPSDISLLIAQSWERCQARLNPHQKVVLARLRGDSLLFAQVTNFELLSIACPIMEDIYQYIEGSNAVVILTNRAGCILDMLGDKPMVEFAQEHGIVKGSVLSEDQMGTNAIALAIIERVPVQVGGAEHYRRQFHAFSGAAAPIFDLSGNPLGALGVLNFAKDHHPHSLGLVVAGARAIEGQRQSDQLLGEYNSQLTELNAILTTISEGILVWNCKGILMHANPAATRLLGLSTDILVGRQINEYIHFPPFVQDAIDKYKILTDVETNLIVGERLLNCIFSLQFVRSRKGVQRIIAILRRTKDVRRLVQRQMGAQATLTLNNLIGESPEMRRVRRVAKSASRARASILIRGESGTGKNLLARAVHNQSPRRDGPFIIFSCASVPSELIIPELVGYEEELDTHRGRSRPSKFELAEGGTLFFQDVDALPLETQAVLVNVLELGIVQRLGSTRPIEVDVRVIAATSGDLEKRVAEGSFRADLFYRLSPFEIYIPPLRERESDFSLLVDRILQRFSQQHDRPLALAPETLSIMRGYSWPGNVRELEAVLERAVVQAGASQVIGPMHLPVFVRYPEKHSLAAPEIVKVPTLDVVEREAILQAVQLYKGNVTQMARALGIGRTTMWRRLKQLDLSPDQFREKRLSQSK